MKTAIATKRADNFARWYQEVVDEAGLAEESGVRGCMVIKPWGWALWELLSRELDQRIKDAGHDNCYFPLLIPLSHIATEAEHVDGFAKEMAVVTHHRLKSINGKLLPDPDARLEEPLIVRPTSETIIGAAMSRWIQSYRDLPLKINQWANVMRWEMRPRMFLRSSEFLWQEGHTAHATALEAIDHARMIIGLYERFVREVLGIPVVVGEKPEHERFPGAETTLSIEAMMQDGRALQAGTSHYLGTHFAVAQGIQFQDSNGERVYASTTSWGASTRLIGGLIMTHGDDDGLRLPPRVAPHQVVIIPILRGGTADSQTLERAANLKDELQSLRAFEAPVRAHVDLSQAKSQDKRWQWVKRGAPIICELGPRDVATSSVTYLRRDRLRTLDGQIKTHTVSGNDFASMMAELCSEIQDNLTSEAETFLGRNIETNIRTFEDLAAFYTGYSENSIGKGWVRAAWCRPTGAELETVIERLKKLKLTIRVAPLNQDRRAATCLFTGRAAAEEVIIGRTY